MRELVAAGALGEPVHVELLRLRPRQPLRPGAPRRPAPLGSRAARQAVPQHHRPRGEQDLRVPPRRAVAVVAARLRCGPSASATRATSSLTSCGSILSGAGSAPISTFSAAHPPRRALRARVRDGGDARRRLRLAHRHAGARPTLPSAIGRLLPAFQQAGGLLREGAGTSGASLATTSTTSPGCAPSSGASTSVARDGPPPIPIATSCGSRAARRDLRPGRRRERAMTARFTGPPASWAPALVARLLARGREALRLLSRPGPAPSGSTRWSTKRAGADVEVVAGLAYRRRRLRLAVAGWTSFTTSRRDAGRRRRASPTASSPASTCGRDRRRGAAGLGRAGRRRSLCTAWRGWARAPRRRDTPLERHPERRDRLRAGQAEAGAAVLGLPRAPRPAARGPASGRRSRARRRPSPRRVGLDLFGFFLTWAATTCCRSTTSRTAPRRSRSRASPTGRGPGVQHDRRRASDLRRVPARLPARG